MKAYIPTDYQVKRANQDSKLVDHASKAINSAVNFAEPFLVIGGFGAIGQAARVPKMFASVGKGMQSGASRFHKTTQKVVKRQ